MGDRKKEGALTKDEKRIVKALLNAKWRNQDIQALVNIGRAATVNSARITEVKKDAVQKAATEDEVTFYRVRKKSFDPITGLNLFDDERLIRAREAMILAVQIFNSASYKFKTEVFAVISNIAWTYILHEYYERKKVKIISDDGWSLPLSNMIERADCPLTDGMRNNLRAIKTIRDAVEHKLFGRGDLKWKSLFQACCLNFDKALCELFGAQLTLSNELAFALQFTKMDVDQLATINKYEIPPHIEAIDARLEDALTEEQRRDLEYQFRVIYTLDAASKSRSHIEFFHPESAEGKEIRNVLVQYRTADHLYPYKPSLVSKIVNTKSSHNFTLHNHTQAWRLYKVRPVKGAKQPENTDKDYCIYHATHGDYTYSEKWVERLVKAVIDEQEYNKIRAVKI